MRFYKKMTLWALLPVALFCALAGNAIAENAKNVIVLIADGCSSEQYTLARWFKGSPLSFDELRVGAVKTYIADSVIADSAPTASAYATGYRTSDKLISVGPKSDVLSTLSRPPQDLEYRPLATVLEGAKLKGKAVGIVATSRVTHATPAAYMAHAPLRSMENDIMEQAVYQNIDVVLGGGKRYLLPKEAGGVRTDGENLIDVLQARGYRIVENRDDLMALTTGKVFGVFAKNHMEAEIDRPQTAPQQPTLAEMTRKAIELLSQDPDGFFLMVEASQVDWADHANDPGHLLSDLLMYDKAVQVALDFARQDGHTLLLALSDHNTGGMSLGNASTSRTYSQLKVETLLEPLKKITMSTSRMWKDGDSGSVEGIKEMVRKGWGLDITDDIANQILQVARRQKDIKKGGYYALGEVLSSNYTVIGWTTHGHVGGDVPLSAFGPGRPSGVVDGPDIGKITARALGVDLDELNKTLFVDAATAFPDGQVTIDESDKNNPVVKIKVKDLTCELPVNKNILITQGSNSDLDGVVVFAPDTGKAYLPLQAVKSIQEKTKHQ